MNDRATGLAVDSTGPFAFLKGQMLRFVLAVGALLFIVTVGTLLFIVAIGASLLGREAKTQG